MVTAVENLRFACKPIQNSQQSVAKLLLCIILARDKLLGGPAQLFLLFRTFFQHLDKRFTERLLEHLGSVL